MTTPFIPESRRGKIPMNKFYWRGIETTPYILHPILFRINTNAGMRQIDSIGSHTSKITVKSWGG